MKYCRTWATRHERAEDEVSNQILRLKIGVILTVILSLAVVILVPPSSVVGMTLRVGPEGLPLPQLDFSLVPQSVVDDANWFATELYGDYQDTCEDFANQLLVTYLEAVDEDVVVFFNSGGWGWNILEASPQWTSIFTGIQAELADLGYTSILVNYQRAVNNIRGYVDECMSMISLYPSQAKDLASRIKFLTRNIKDLKVIIVGESNGSIIADSVMSILRDNQQVYSIQTGPPFWHKNIMLDRTLVLRSNEIIPDSFSRGDFLAMIASSLEALFGFNKSEDNPGRILFYVRAPGHEYWWQDPGVYSQITNFLQQDFKLKM
jgi:hypothetical protein